MTTPNYFHRKKPRLPGVDYSTEGYYFITICTEGHKCIFGNVRNGKMVLNEAGKLVEKWWLELKNKYPSINLDVYQIMPNHLHGVIEIVDSVGLRADTQVRPYIVVNPVLPNYDSSVGVDLCVDPQPNKTRPQQSLFQIVRWFKTQVTNEYIKNVKILKWPRFETRLFQRSYYEHIIRDEEPYNRIVYYVKDNPRKWTEDKFYVENI